MMDIRRAEDWGRIAWLIKQKIMSFGYQQTSAVYNWNGSTQREAELSRNEYNRRGQQDIWREVDTIVFGGRNDLGPNGGLLDDFMQRVHYDVWRELNEDNSK